MRILGNLRAADVALSNLTATTLFNGGSNILSSIVRNVVDVTGNTVTIYEGDYTSTFNITYDGDYSVILPSLSNVNGAQIYKLKNFTNKYSTGTIQPFSGDLIEGVSSFKFYGIGSISIKKETNQHGDSSWSLVESSNLKSSIRDGEPKIESFTNKDEVTINHGLGYAPMVVVWAEDGLGGYSDIDVDIDHDFINKNSFTVNLLNAQNGIIFYI